MRLQHLIGNVSVLKSVGTLVALAIIAAAGCASAATVAVNCPAQSISSAITTFFGANGRPASLEKLTINVSGTCTENILIPPLREIELIGVSSAVLRPKVQSVPALHVQGRGLIRNFTVVSSGVVGFPSGLIQTGPYGYLRIESAAVASTTAKILVQAYHTSTVEIRNSFISGGADAAVEISNNAHGFIYAEGGGTTTIRNPSNPSGAAIGCYQANVTVWAIGASSSVIVGPTGIGLGGSNCTARIGGFDTGAGFVRFTGATDIAIGGFSGDSFLIVQTLITGNPGQAVSTRGGTIRINTSTIGNNGSGVYANQGGVIFFDDNYGPNNVFQTVDPYNCYQGGKIYADPGDINGADEYCLQVGEGD